MSGIHWNPASPKKTDDSRILTDDYCDSCCPDILRALPRTSTHMSIPSLDAVSDRPTDVDENRYSWFRDQLHLEHPDRRYQVRGTKTRTVKGIISGHLVPSGSPPQIAPAKFDAKKEIRELFRFKSKGKRTPERNPADCTIGKANLGIQDSCWEKRDDKDLWERRLVRRIGRYFACLRLRVSRSMARWKVGLLLGKTPVVDGLAASAVDYRCTEIFINHIEYVNVDLL